MHNFENYKSIFSLVTFYAPDHNMMIHEKWQKIAFLLGKPLYHSIVFLLYQFALSIINYFCSPENYSVSVSLTFKKCDFFMKYQKCFKKWISRNMLSFLCSQKNGSVHLWIRPSPYVRGGLTWVIDGVAIHSVM